MTRVGAFRIASQRAKVHPHTLPEIVQKFTARAGVSPDSAPGSVHLFQSAELRMGADKPWKSITCEQVISIDKPGFVWLADRRLAGFSVIRVVDAFVEDRGFLEARIFGSLPVARLSGPEADRSELMRYLAELAWAPDAALYNTSLRWHAIGDDAVEVEADSTGGIARVTLKFNADGDIVEMHADERGSRENGVMVPRPWRGVFSEHRQIAGRRIPTHGEVGYLYRHGYSPYWRGYVTDYRTD